LISGAGGGHAQNNGTGVPNPMKLGSTLGTIYKRTHTKSERVWLGGCGTMGVPMFFDLRGRRRTCPE